jgi:hypothetical protein
MKPTQAAMQSLFQKSAPVVPLRGAHLDLKGMPPTAERLADLPALLAAARYNVVLVEWEDAFPWTADVRFRSPTAYGPETVRRFAAAAREHGLEVIPLVQCLGHMETPLSVPGAERLREAEDDPSTLNPLAPGARELVESMVDDVLRLLPETRYFHLGGDEARRLGAHPDTAAYLAAHGKGALYLRHVGPILDRLNARGIRPILWHDMMVEWDDDALRALAPRCDLMVWGYNGHPDTTPHHFHSRHIRRFRDLGLALWGATAFKGADGMSADLPDLARRQANAAAWVEVARRFGMKGIVATGWSRYGTFTAACETLESSLDALVAIGVQLHDGQPPAGGADAVAAALDALGEGVRFRACREAMRLLAAVRRNGWEECRNLLELHALHRRFAPRGHPHLAVSSLRYARNIMKTGFEAEGKVRHALAGRVEPVWIDEYLHARLAPLREAYERAVRDWNLPL